MYSLIFDYLSWEMIALGLSKLTKMTWISARSIDQIHLTIVYFWIYFISECLEFILFEF